MGRNFDAYIKNFCNEERTLIAEFQSSGSNPEATKVRKALELKTPEGTEIYETAEGIDDLLTLCELHKCRTKCGGCSCAECFFGAVRRGIYEEFRKQYMNAMEHGYGPVDGFRVIIEYS